MLETVRSLESLAKYNLQSRPERATYLWGATEALRHAVDAPSTLSDQDTLNETVTLLRQTLGDATFEEIWAKGRASTVDEAVALALADAHPPDADVTLT